MEIELAALIRFGPNRRWISKVSLRGLASRVSALSGKKVSYEGVRKWREDPHYWQGLIWLLAEEIIRALRRESPPKRTLKLPERTEGRDKLFEWNVHKQWTGPITCNLDRKEKDESKRKHYQDAASYVERVKQDWDKVVWLDDQDAERMSQAVNASAKAAKARAKAATARAKAAKARALTSPDDPDVKVEWVDLVQGDTGTAFDYAACDDAASRRAAQVLKEVTGEPGLKAPPIAMDAAQCELRTAREEAEAFLRQVLADGAVAVDTINEQANALGITERTLKRARAALKVKASRVGGFGGDGGWTLSLP